MDLSSLFICNGPINQPNPLHSHSGLITNMINMWVDEKYALSLSVFVSFHGEVAKFNVFLKYLFFRKRTLTCNMKISKFGSKHPNLYLQFLHFIEI